MPGLSALVRPLVLAVLGAAGCTTATAPSASGPLPPLDDVPEAVQRVADRLPFDPAVFGDLHELHDPPLRQWRQRYDFTPDARWLERVRAATVRLGEHCSGAIVSPDGLVLTAQSCVRECITATTTSAERDDPGRAVSTRSPGEERLCPGLFVDRLRNVRDITSQIDEAIANAAPGDAFWSVAAARAKLVQNCGAAPGRVCQAVPLFGGARWHLYEYDRTTHVKLVFATEPQLANPGRGADQLAWPRHALDYALIRLHDRDGRRPLRTPAHFTLRTAPPAEDEPMFVAWSPGSSSRLATMSQLAYERDVRHPQNVKVLEGLSSFLDTVADDAWMRPGVRDELFNARGSLALFRGQLAVLRDSLVPGTRLRWERELRAGVDADPALRARFADLWDTMDEIQRRKAALSPRLNVTNIQIIGAPHLIYATELAAWVRAMAIPADRRPREWTGERRDRAEHLLSREYELGNEMATRFLAVHLAMIADWIEPNDPIRAGLMLPGETPDAAAKRLAGRSRVLDARYRAQIMRGGPAALESTDDPLLRHAVVLDSIYREVLETWRGLLADEDRERRRLGLAALAVFGNGIAADATFSPRIAAGIVRGYADGDDVLPAHTTFYGLYERWQGAGTGIPGSFRRRPRDMDLGTPLNFVITADAFGSGGAVVDTRGRLAGVMIGTNAQHLGNRFAFVGGDGRVVVLHAAAIAESLREIYRAGRLTSALTIDREARE